MLRDLSSGSLVCHEVHEERFIRKHNSRRQAAHRCFHKIVVAVVLAPDNLGELLDCYGTNGAVEASILHRQSEAMALRFMHAWSRVHTVGQNEGCQRQY